MLSEEEKKAIELLKQEPDFSLNYYNRENAIDIVLSLIEKQQKEIEKLEEKSKKCEYYEMVADELYKNGISKDKLEEKKEQLENKISCNVLYGRDSKDYYHYLSQIQILEELLEERK